jgi:hypothetical protein
MTVKTFWLNALTPETSVRYVVVPTKGTEWTVSIRDAARMDQDPEFPVGWVIEKRVSTKMVKACPWCGARPELFEMDCDGWAGTGTCGSEQCNQLKVCEGCGQFDVQRWGCWRGRLCQHCYEVANRDNLATIPGEYGLFRHEDYSKHYAW